MYLKALLKYIFQGGHRADKFSWLHFLFLLFKARWRGEVESNFYFWYIIMVLTESIIFSKSKYSLLRWHENIPRSQDQKDNRDKNAKKLG